MEEISVKIRDANWTDVIDYLEICGDGLVKPDLYHKLSKLYEIYNRAIKLSRHTWFENYKVPKIDHKHWVELSLNVTAREKLKKEIVDLNEVIYHHLTCLDNDIMKYMQKYYALGTTYNQAKNDRIPSMFDKDSIMVGLKQKISQNMFEDKISAKNAMETYRYLLELQTILQRLKSVKTNEDIEIMLKLVQYTKAQLKQIVDDLGCKLCVKYGSDIEIAQHKPDGTNKKLYYTQQSRNVF